MSFDMNSGYSGWSMSKNAVAAYEAGEMPKSKWTKKAILAEIESYCDEYDLFYVEPAGTKAELFDRFIEIKSWHHTSKFCNATDFYGLNEEEVEESFDQMTEEQIADRDAARKAAREQAEAERKAYAERVKAEREYAAAFKAERGYEFGSVKHYIAENPERAQFFTNPAGKDLVVVHTGERTAVFEAKRIGYTAAHWFNPEMDI